MLRQLTLKNFKLFKEATPIPLANLNLLTGINGRGKSTVLQSLLLMRQSPEYDRTTSKIIFNGDDIRMGNFQDVKNIASSPSEPIELTFHYDDFHILYQIFQNSNDPVVGDIGNIYLTGKVEGADIALRLINNEGMFNYSVNQEEIDAMSMIYLHDLFIHDADVEGVLGDGIGPHIKGALNFNRVHYVAADRIGPKLFYNEKSLKDFYSVGPFGEETVNILHHKASDLLEEEFIENIARLFHLDPEEIGRDVELQTTFWLSKLFTSVKYRIKRVEDANLLTFSISPEGTFDYYKPTNVGYGFSYVLPIIVTGLIAKRGDLFLVENPEAHLHPHAQSVLAKFLTLVSLRGVQVIIESHSEHVLNGLRIPVYDRIIPNTHLNVLYFDRSQAGYFTKIDVAEDGGIENWPPDFFDQSTKDLNYLFGI